MSPQFAHNLGHTLHTIPQFKQCDLYNVSCAYLCLPTVRTYEDQQPVSTFLHQLSLVSVTLSKTLKRFLLEWFLRFCITVSSLCPPGLCLRPRQGLFLNGSSNSVCYLYNVICAYLCPWRIRTVGTYEDQQPVSTFHLLCLVSKTFKRFLLDWFLQLCITVSSLCPPRLCLRPWQGCFLNNSPLYSEKDRKKSSLFA